MQKFAHMLGFVVNSVLTSAILYNLHHSFKARDRAERKFYKYYFMVMTLLFATDNLLGFLLYKIPYYRLFKLTLGLWLSVPQSTGPRFIYNVYVKNIYQLFEGDIDAVFQNLKVYFEAIQEKYYAAMHRTGECGKIGFSVSECEKKSKAEDALHESSDADPSLSAISNDNTPAEEPQ